MRALKALRIFGVVWITLFAFLGVSSTLAADADSDGLADELEASLGTNPNLADTDGDGAGDGLEVRAGTDPKLLSSLFKVVGAPSRTPNGWQISWNSVAGRSYRLQRISGDAPVPDALWTDVQTVQAAAATASAVDADTGSTRRFYRVVLLEATNQVSVAIGEIILVSDSFQTNSTSVTAGGDITIGLVTISTEQSLLLDANAGTLSGEGEVRFSGIGVMIDGAFTIDTRTGALSAGTAASIDSEIPVSPGSVLVATELKINVKTGAIEGRGTIQMDLPGSPDALQAMAQIPGTPDPDVLLSGSFSIDPTNRTATVAGTASFAGVTGTGTATVRLNDLTFTLPGDIRIPSGIAGDALILSEASFQLRLNAQSKAEFALDGKPAITVLSQLGLRVGGTMDSRGDLSLSGEAMGIFGPFFFNPVTVTVRRDSSDGALVAVKYRGVLGVQGVQPFILNGQVMLDGRIAPPELEGSLGLGGGISIQPPPNVPTKLRLSVKFILDSSGNRPMRFTDDDGNTLGTPLLTDDDVRTQINIGNEILNRAGNQFQFELIEIREVSNAGQWFNADARSTTARLDLQNAALQNPEQYFFRKDAVNIYINSSTNSGNSALFLPDQIILIGQGGQPTTIPHEIGHYFGLWHTQGRLCGNCEEPPAKDLPFLPADLCVSTPDSDDVMDTIPDLECWNTNQIAQYTFQKNFTSLTSSEQAQVNAVYFNLMSYHQDGRDRLTDGQVARIAFNANGPRFHVVGRPTVLQMISETSAQIDFKVDGEFMLTFGTASHALRLNGTMSLGKSANSYAISAFSAGSISSDLSLNVFPGVRLDNARVNVTKAPSGEFEVTLSGRANIGGINGLEVTGKLANGQLNLTTSLPPQTFGEFRLEGSTGGNLTASVGPNGLAVSAGARLLYKGQPLTAPALPAFTIGLGGDMSVSANASATVGFNLNGYNLTDSSFTFEVQAGIAAIRNFRGNLSIPGLSAGASVTLEGSLNSNGSFLLSGTASAGLNFAGLSLGTIEPGATVTLTETGLSISGGLNGATLAQLNIPRPTIALSVSATGEISLTGGASVTVSPIVIGQFRIESPTGSGFTATISPNGITIPAGARLLYKGTPLTTASLPQIQFGASANASIAVTAGMTAGLKIDGYDLSNSSFTLQISAGVAAAQGFGGSLSIPGLSVTGSVALAGALNSNGTFLLSGTVGSSLNFTTLSLGTIDPGATATLTESGLLISGGLTSATMLQLNIPKQTLALRVSVTGEVTITGGASVTVSPITLGQFRVESSTGGGFTVALTPTGITIPLGARLLYKGVALTTASLPQIHVSASAGASISITAGMTAGLQLDGYNLSNSSFTFQINGGIAVAQNFSGSLSVPGLAGMSIGLAGSLNSNGTFSLTGTTAANLTLNGFAVTTMSAGASATLNQTGLTIVGTLGGGVLAQVTTVGSVTGTLAITSGGVISLNGTVTVAPIVLGQFRIEPAAGGNFTASLGATLSIPAGKRVLLNAAPLIDVNLPAFSIAANGDFSVNSGSGTISLAGFTINSGSFRLQRVNGVTSAQTVVGSLRVPGPSASVLANVSVNGSINSNGTFSLSGTTAAGITLTGQAVTSLSTGASVTFNQTALTLAGTLTGGVLGQVQTVGSATGTLTVASNGIISLTGTVTVAPIVVGQLRLEPSAGGNFSATLGASLNIPAGARILLNALPLINVSLPAFSVATNGDFSVNSGSGTISLGGFTINSGSLRVQRVGGVMSVQNVAGSLRVPGPSASVLANVNVTGSINSNGTFSLTGTTGAAITLTGQAVTTLLTGASVAFNQTALTLTGTLSGGVLAQVQTAASVTGTVTIASNGTQSVSANVTISPIVVGSLRLEGPSGGNLSATLGTTLNVASGARIEFNGVQLINVSLPAFSIATSGDFSITSGSGTITLGGFTINSGSLRVQRVSGVMSVQNVAGSLRVPGPGGTVFVNVSVTGSINSNGTYVVTGSTSAGLTLTGLPVTGLGSGATVVLSQTGLTLQGVVSGGITTTVAPVGSAQALLTIASNGTITISGNLTIFPIIDTPFRIESSSGGNLTATFSNAGLRITGARLEVTGIFGAEVNLPEINLPSSGNFTLNVSTPSLAIFGFPFSNVTFTLRRNSGAISIDPFSGRLNMPGFNQTLTGTINSAGTVTLDYDGSLTMGGFTAANGWLDFRNSGLRAGGTFNLQYNGHSWGSVAFSGFVNYSSGVVSYNLARDSGGINISGFSIPSPNITLSSQGYVTGNASLAYGSINVPLNNLRISSSTGLSFNNYVHSVDSGEKQVLDNPFGSTGDGFVRLSGNVTFSRDGNGIKATLNYTWNGRINGAGSWSFSDSGSIGTNGEFHVGGRNGLPGFTFDLF